MSILFININKNLKFQIMDLKICSINCHSFRTEIKQAPIYDFLNRNSINICCLQETWMDGMHYKKDLMKDWQCDAFLSPAPANNSAGVAILIKKVLNIQLIKIYNDAEGRLVFVDFLFQGQAYRLINIYAPTDENSRKDFFTFLSIFTNCNKSIILAGDFNMIESNLDKKGGNFDTGYGGKEILSDIRTTSGIGDAFRHLYPRKWEFSYYNSYFQVYTRIDRIYSTKTLSNHIHEFTYRPFCCNLYV